MATSNVAFRTLALGLGAGGGFSTPIANRRRITAVFENQARSILEDRARRSNRSVSDVDFIAGTSLPADDALVSLTTPGVGNFLVRKDPAYNERLGSVVGEARDCILAKTPRAALWCPGASLEVTSGTRPAHCYCGPPRS